MQLEDYFEFEKVEGLDRIRIRGTRMAIEFIIREYLAGCLPEQIAANYRRSVTLEQVFASLTYYMHNKCEMDVYLDRCDAASESAHQEYLKHEPPEVVKRLKAIMADREKNAAKPV